MLIKIILSFFKTDHKSNYACTNNKPHESNYFQEDHYPKLGLNSDPSILPWSKVKWIVDGDTIIIAKGWNGTKIRLDSIDCPEDGQEWGDVAKYGLVKLVGGQRVYLEQHGCDSYGRLLATLYVWSSNKQEWLNVNERMVTLGHAWVMRRFYNHLPKERQNKLNALEGWARSKKVGLWKSGNPTPPWEWRKS